MANTNTEKADDDYGWKIFGVISALVIISCFIFWFLFKDIKDRGTFGDMFGAINAMFSGLAFAGVIVAIHLQQKELENTRKEIKGQKEEMQLQNATLIRQNFENTFFSLLKLLQDLTNSCDYKPSTSSITYRGKDCFKAMHRVFKNFHGSQVVKGQKKDRDGVITYLDFYQEHQSDLGHFFRSIYYILKFVDESDLSNKKFYTDLLRAQLSTFETALLFYHAASSLDQEHLKPLIERYSILKDLCFDELLHPMDESHFRPVAFEHED